MRRREAVSKSPNYAASRSVSVRLRSRRNVKELLYESARLCSLSLFTLLSISLFLLSFSAGRDAFVEAYQRDTGAARKRRVTRVISTMETEPRARAVPGGVGVSALGSKVRDYNIPGMPFRVHQFGTPVPSLRSSRRRVRERESFLLSCRPSFSLPARCGPFQTSAKLRGSASRLCFLFPSLSSSSRAYAPCSKERARGSILSRKDPLSGNR